MKLTEEQRKLVDDNKKLVSYVIKYKNIYIPYGEYEDCVQCGYVALCKAAKGYDKDMGFTFASYAIPIIFRDISTYLKKQTSFIRAPKRISLKSDVNFVSENADKNITQTAIESICRKYNISEREYLRLIPTLYINDINSDELSENSNTTINETMFEDKSQISVEDTVNLRDSKELIIDTINKFKNMLIRGNFSKENINIFCEWCYNICMGNQITLEDLGEKYNKSRQVISKSIRTYQRYILNHINNKQMQNVLEDLKFNAKILSNCITNIDF